MSRFHSYITSAFKIIDTYKGEKPLVFHLKDFFSGQKKYGSRDRKLISSLCYYYFRAATGLNDLPVEERILASLFLCENKNSELLAAFREDWNEKISLPAEEKLAFLHIDPLKLFPFFDDITGSIDKKQFAISFLTQPDLFLRIRPGRHKQVIARLDENNLLFREENGSCLRLMNSTSVDSVLNVNREVVIQDVNSQKVLQFLEDHPDFFSGKQKPDCWDCCAASGGKSILLYDVLHGKMRLTVSDIRENILANLSKRLQEAGINIQNKFIADLTKACPLPKDELFSVIICDVPCTGSGTWARTPEQLYYFKTELIQQYAEKQQKIVSNAITHLEPSGLFFYITCSVFEKENEEVVNFIKEKFELKQLQMKYLEGYEIKADTMFVAVFTK